MAKVQTNMAIAMTKAVVNCVNKGGNPGIAGRHVTKEAVKHNVVLPYMGRHVRYNKSSADSAVGNVGVR